MKAKDTNVEDPEMVALKTLGWVISDERRAERLLAITGLTPEGLRERLNDRLLLAAVMGFVMGHESDLLACAEAIHIRPERMAEAASALE